MLDVLEKGLPGGDAASLDTERFVLGSILVGSEFGRVCPPLQKRDFIVDSHRRIFGAMEAMYAAGTPIDRVTLANELQRLGHLEAVGGLAYLISLDDGLPELANIDGYVGAVRDKSMLRRAILAHQRAIDECLLAHDPTPEILERAERSISELMADTLPSGLMTMEAVIEDAGGAMAFIEPERCRKGLETPWPRLNQMLNGGGLQIGQVVVIGARPGEGKSTLAGQVGLHAARNGHPAAIFSLEMQAKSMFNRLIAAHGKVDMQRYGRGLGSQEDQRIVMESMAELAELPLFIDTGSRTVPAIRAACMKQSARRKLELVVVDYLQLIETAATHGRSRHDELGMVSRALKTMAMDLGCVVIAPSQLSREGTKEGRAPQLSDLRDSGSIESDADIVVFPWCSEPKRYEGSDDVPTELLVRKQRDGPIGTVYLMFHKRFTCFEER